ncbi:hypothetical protein PanWU01x14_003000 [Parasponia andersonii]|uniref:Uncharacterized protein n=1 Tax=Parasponia andersonii TaxID=3476 RepID=A0A2P5E5C4_PARAD|nr:hypothetical protein PanWU01x14_003000 [Parasponia andersonii]
MEPWNFNKAMLALKEFDDRESPGRNEFRWMKFWVQMYNLPLSGMTEPIGKILGNKVGNCLEVETDRDGKCWGRDVVFESVLCCGRYFKTIEKGEQRFA